MNSVHQKEVAVDGSRGVVHADQAIFTSIRSPMGAGYRIVSTSPGVRPEERVEITRRSPSHGSLYGAGPTAVALAAYPLPTGRHCVAWSRTAGIEHTGRGGERVYTHILLLTAEAFARFGCNPLAVRQAAPSIAQDPPLLKPLPSLPQLELIPQCRPTSEGPSRMCVDFLCEVAASALAGGRLVVRQDSAAMDALEWALMLTPLASRRKLAVSAGLKLAPSRPMHLAWIGQEQADNGRVSSDQQVRVLLSGQPLSGGIPSPAGWFGLLRRWWRERRWDHICALNGDLAADVRPIDLERVAMLCNALDEVATADQARLADLADHAREQSGHETEQNLRQRLAAAVDRRQQVLREEEELREKAAAILAASCRQRS